MVDICFYCMLMCMSARLHTCLCTIVKRGSITSVAGYLLTALFLIIYFMNSIYIFVGGYWGMNKRVSRPFHNPL